MLIATLLLELTIEGLALRTNVNPNDILLGKINYPISSEHSYLNRWGRESESLQALAAHLLTISNRPALQRTALVAAGGRTRFRQVLMKGRAQFDGLKQTLSDVKQKRTIESRSRKYSAFRSFSALRLPIIMGMWALMGQPAIASGGGGLVSVPAVPLSRGALLARIGLWAVLFSIASLFAGAETAVTALPQWKAKQLADDEGEGSLFRLLESDPQKILEPLLIGMTFCTIFHSSLATEVAIGLFGTRGVGYATFFSTVLTLFFGEILPKTIAVTSPEKVARFCLPIIRFVRILLFPVSLIVQQAMKVVLAILGHDEMAGEIVSKPELRVLLESAAEQGTVEEDEQDIIEGALDMETKPVSKIMTPRVDLVAVDRNTTLLKLREVYSKYRLSRVPVYNGTIDDIVGITLTSKLISLDPSLDESLSDNALWSTPEDTRDSLRNKLENTQVHSVMESIDRLFIPMGMSIKRALKLMKKKRTHMLVVVDEFGGTAGIVTMEDIIEELIGEVYDEDDDQEFVEDSAAIVKQSDGTYIIDGQADFKAVCEELGLDEVIDPEVDDFSRLNGFISSQAGFLPDEGFVVDFHHVRFEVLARDNRKVITVAASNITSPPAEAVEEVSSQQPPNNVDLEI